MAIVYILHSQKLNCYYTGFTLNLDLRLKFHEQAEAPKFTAKANDWLVFLEIPCDSKAQGLAIEKHIKQMKSSVYIENLAKFPEIIAKLRERYK